MTLRIADIPELSGLDAHRGFIRIPADTDVTITGRIRHLIDCSAFRRLAHISQLGLVSLVYPAAHHSRFEHSLGVYRTALCYLRQLAGDARFAETVTVPQAERFLVAALLHDIGHWPFCHPIEDMQLDSLPRHEVGAAEYIHGDEIASRLESDWGIEAAQITALLEGRVESAAESILVSLLSGPIDVDKMDYLQRDSLHAGVPYGRNFDEARLMSSLCLNEQGDAVAITDKGRTAAEMMVFARYVMFSEVYWHHAVRAATAMLQRTIFRLKDDLDFVELVRQSEHQFIETLLHRSQNTSVEHLSQGLFGPRRQLLKRWKQYSLFQRPEIYERLARRPYDWLVKCSDAVAEVLSEETGQEIPPDHVVIDAPPVKREIEINMQVYFAKESRYLRLAEVSPVVQTLAEKQFDDYVKRVRIFVAPTLLPNLEGIRNRDELLQRAIRQMQE